jgi:anion-transporting  ArsA/GET3 family ATPase
MVNKKRILDQFVRRSGLQNNVVEQILNNSIYQKLSTTLSGSQEFTALEKLYASYETGKYDLIILDTPPAAHAIEFLDSAQRLSAFFQESIMKWFAKPLEKRGAFMSLIHRGTNFAFKALERLTGTEFMNELFQFLVEIYGLKDSLKERMDRVHELLLRNTTSFCLVTSFDATKIEEAQSFQAELRERGYRLGYILVNRSFPRWRIEPGESPDPLNQRLIAFYRKLEKFFDHHEKAIEGLRAAVGGEVQFLRIPDFDQEVYDLKSLEKVAAVLAQESVL